MADIKNVDFGKILGVDIHNVDSGVEFGFVDLSGDHKKRLATVAALELIKSSSTDRVDLSRNLENLDRYRDLILGALGENAQ